jgi:hypothetical protein
MGLQPADSRDRTFISATAAVVFSVFVMQPLCAIYAQPYIKVGICQKRAPLIIKKDPIGLEIVPATPSFREVSLLQVHCKPIEAKSGQRWFPAMPCKLHDRPWA